MNTRLRTVLRWTALLAVFTPAPTSGQATARDSLCARVAAARGIERVQSCSSLATAAVTRLTEQQYTPVRLEPRDLQNTNAGASAAGSGAQDEAVPSVQPTGAGAASLSAVGADSGLTSIATVSLNPAMFFVPTDNPDRMARASRVADLSLLVPVGEADKDNNGRPDYFGVRFRLNLNGAQAGATLATAANAFLTQVHGEAAMRSRIIGALNTLAGIDGCVSALFAEDPSAGTIEAQCGAGVSLDAEAYEDMRQKIAAARAAADAKYFGLDLRADFGDPTLGGVTNAAATALSAALAFGKQMTGVDGRSASVGVRGRAGMRYSELRSTGVGSSAFEAGFGLEARKPLDDITSILLTAGLESRYGGDEVDEEQLQTNYTSFRATLSIPVAGATALAIAWGTPIAGKVSPTFSVNFNWKLLLPKVGLPIP